MKILSITAPNPGPFTLDGTRTYLLGESAVIDPGPAVESHVLAIVVCMPRLETILITHRHADHAPGALLLKRLTGATIVAPAGALETIDRQVTGGEQLDVEDVTIDVIATPGHTAEHVCYLTADGDLFTGDTVLGAGTSAIFPPDGHMGDYIRSLQKLRSLQPKRIFPAHGPVRDDAVALIDEYIAHRLDRERQIVEALAAGEATIPQLRAKIYRDLDPGLERAAEIQLSAHLVKLAEEKHVVEQAGLYRLS